MKKEMVISYIDGFNLYFGLRAMGWAKYYWMNVETLSLNLLKKHQLLAATHYFTSRITRKPDKQRRQSTFLEALEVMGIRPYYGRYRHNDYTCYNSNTIHKIPQEKMTDVAIGVQLVVDAHNNKFDTALVITGDIDLIPAIKAVKHISRHKKVIMVFPPMRACSDFDGIADGRLNIDERLCKKSQMPDVVTRSDGFELHKPVEWQ